MNQKNDQKVLKKCHFYKFCLLAVTGGINFPLKKHPLLG